MSDSATVAAQNVSKIYRVGEVAVPALQGVSLTVEPGEFVGIVGASGSGKSTLLHILGGLTTPTSGRLTIAGREFGGLSDAGRTALRRQCIGVIFQKFNLLPTLDAADNIAMARAIARAPRDAAYERSLVERLGLEGRLHHRPAQLSGGEQQRVAIARALINRPRILLADEPTGNLDSQNADAVLTLLAALHRDLCQTILMITHSATAAGFAQRTLYMRDGRVVPDATVTML